MPTYIFLHFLKYIQTSFSRWEKRNRALDSHTLVKISKLIGWEFLYHCWGIHVSNISLASNLPIPWQFYLFQIPISIAWLFGWHWPYWYNPHGSLFMGNPTSRWWKGTHLFYCYHCINCFGCRNVLCWFTFALTCHLFTCLMHCTKSGLVSFTSFFWNGDLLRSSKLYYPNNWQYMS